MSEYRIDGSSLDAIVNAINAKISGSAKMTPAQMVAAIQSIPTGGGGSATLIDKTITSNGVYNASDDNADGYKKVTVSVSGGCGSSGWSHQQYTLSENWTTTAAGGNTQNFYDTYLSGTEGKVVIAIISNNTVTGNSKAVSVVGINATGYSANASAKVLFFNRANATNLLGTNYDFFMSAGSVIDVYTHDFPLV